MAISKEDFCTGKIFQHGNMPNVTYRLNTDRYQIERNHNISLDGFHYYAAPAAIDDNGFLEYVPLMDYKFSVNRILFSDLIIVGS